jgi:tetratricopeptide (TPR) repeat protein
MLFLHLIPVILFITGDHRSVNNKRSSKVSSSSSSLFDKKTTATTYEVCLSPGCVADGAEETLAKMQALAPPNRIIVKSGVCCSLCGNGPVVLDESNNKKYRKVSKDEKLVEILFGEEGMNSQQAAVLEGFNFVSEANDALNRKDYEKAVELYEKGITIGLQPSLDLVATIDTTGDDESKEKPCSVVPPTAGSLQWLITARQSEATARLNLGDSDGALLAAQSACELSQNVSPDALEVLHEVYGSKGDAGGELKALRALFGLPEPEKLTTMQANKRRGLGFRFAKLERESSQK